MLISTVRQVLHDLRDALGGTIPSTVAPPAEAPAGSAEPTEIPADQPGDGRAAGANAEAEPTRAPSAPRGRRLWAGGAALVLVVGLFLARWAPWDAREPADPTVVATYRGGVVTGEQIRQEFVAIPKEEQPHYRSVGGIRALVGHAVVDAVTRRWASERQVDQKQAFTEAMKHATEEIKIADVSDQLHEGRVQVGEAEIQAYYDQNRRQFGDRPLVEVREQVRQAVVEEKEQPFVEGYLKDLKERASLQVDYGLLEVPEPAEQELVAYYQNNRERFRVPEQARVAEIQVSVALAGGDEKARARAESARARAAAGEDFALLAGEFGDGPRKAQGGELADPVARGGRSPEFDAAVFQLQPGELSPAFKEGDSYYVEKLIERWPERLRPYEEVRGEIAGTLRTEREQQVYSDRKDRTLFTIHSRRTTLGEFLGELNELPAEVRGQYSGAEGKRRILDNLIERLLVVEDASEQAVDVKRSKEIDHARTELMAQFLHEEEVDAKLTASDAEVRAEYDRDKARYADPARVKVRYIRVGRGASGDTDEKARAKIQEAEAKLKPGGLFGSGGQPADFAEVAKGYSEDPDTAAKGGELDRWLGESGDPMAELFEHPLHEELLGLKVGEISPILPLGDSYYLFQVRERQESRQRPFEEAKEVVAQDLKARKHAELTANMERQLLERMQLRMYDGRIQGLLAELGGQAPGNRSSGNR